MGKTWILNVLNLKNVLAIAFFGPAAFLAYTPFFQRNAHF